MGMSDEAVEDPVARQKAEKAHERIDKKEEIHTSHDRRITRNENYRIQAQGALKVLAVVIGSGIAAEVLLNVF